jgi:penicillin-binding protein 2
MAFRLFGGAARRARRAATLGFDPDEVMIDAENLAGFDAARPEGRLELPLSRATLATLGALAVLFVVGFSARLGYLQIARGEAYALRAESNRIEEEVIFAERGTIVDRNGVPLAWNEPLSPDRPWRRREYFESPGFATLLGYVSYPKLDSSGNLTETEIKGLAGVERSYDRALAGENGALLVEVDARGEVVSDGTAQPAAHGQSVTLSVDSRLQGALADALAKVVDERGFVGGAAGVMDLRTGEILAMASYPEYDPETMSDGDDDGAIADWLADERQPFLNRFSGGVFTPGSIVKPYFAAAALEEKTATPNTTVYSDGEMEVPNPYNPDQPSIFTDWKAHGYVDMREAIAVSSNIFFYTIGGGVAGQQEGLGIARLERYARSFGFGEPIEDLALRGPEGTVPNPEWKEANFDGDPWRLGDTYFTSIGQYGFQATPAQALRAVSGLATGRLVEPTLVARAEGEPLPEFEAVPVADEHLQVVREGMRRGALEGTARALNIPGLEIAAKTGTAEVGATKAKVNSWVMGYWPYEEPRYAFVTLLERGDRANLFGASPGTRVFFDWMAQNAPEYVYVD